MKSKLTYTQSEADEIIFLIREKLKADGAKQKTIRAKIRAKGFGASEFGFRGGYTVEDFLSIAKIVNKSSGLAPVKNAASPQGLHSRKIKTASKRSHSDECYVIDLCDKVLKQKARRQHRFDFLRGDSGVRLPVDAYYPSLNLAVEYCERQHSEEVKLFDKRETVSGMTRGEQRKLYDRRRRETLPKHGIRLLEIAYHQFDFNSRKQIARNEERDIPIVRRCLRPIISGI